LKESIGAAHPRHQPDGARRGRKIYNCNADVAARSRIALRPRLVFMSDVPGFLRDPKKHRLNHSAPANTEVDGSKNPA